jgi:hypothetical protein
MGLVEKTYPLSFFFSPEPFPSLLQETDNPLARLRGDRATGLSNAGMAEEF